MGHPHHYKPRTHKYYRKQRRDRGFVPFKWLAIGSVVLLLAGVGYRWYQDWREWKRVEAELSVIQDIADEAGAEAERLEEVKERQDSLFADSTEKLHKKIVQLEREEQVSAARQDSLTDELTSLLADNPAALSTLDRLNAAHEARIVALNNIIFAKDEEIAMLHERIAVRDSINANLWTALEANEELAEYWKREAKPKFWRDVGRALPMVLGGVAVGAVATAAIIN